MTGQDDLFSTLTAVDQVLAPTAGRVHHHPLATERAAAERVSLRSGTQKALLLLALAERGEAIPHEIYRQAGCAYPHVATTRLADFKDEGWVERLEAKRPTATCSAHVWRITDEGRRVAEQLKTVVA